jgi:hypothetical protein
LVFGCPRLAKWARVPHQLLDLFIGFLALFSRNCMAIDQDRLF